MNNKKHTKNIITKIFGVFFMLVAIMTVTEDLHFRFSSDRSWFEYYPPKVEAVIVGDTIRFSSNSEYKKDLRVEWYDTLYCEKNNGSIYRGDTQYLVDYKKAGDVSDREATWGYKDFPDADTVSICRMCGEIIGYTPSTPFKPSGYEKKDSYCSEWFEY